MSLVKKQLTKAQNKLKNKLMIFKLDNTHETENMASLLDTYCSIGKNVQTIWLKSPPSASATTPNSSSNNNGEQSSTSSVSAVAQNRQQIMSQERKSSGSAAENLSLNEKSSPHKQLTNKSRFYYMMQSNFIIIEPLIWLEN